MSGYIGNPDAESEHALILAENGIAASQEMLRGHVFVHCLDCGDEIPKARRDYAVKLGHKCEYCITCQEDHDKVPKIKMLDRIL
jgi:RNA polymerase-binding transcription factor DksA